MCVFNKKKIVDWLLSVKFAHGLHKCVSLCMNKVVALSIQDDWWCVVGAQRKSTRFKCEVYKLFIVLSVLHF